MTSSKRFHLQKPELWIVITRFSAHLTRASRFVYLILTAFDGDPMVLPAVTRPIHWQLMVNPKSGQFKGPYLATDVVQNWQTQHPDTPIWLHLTYPQKGNRHERITKAIADAKNAADQGPTGVIAFGGDGTVNDVLIGILNYIFPKEGEFLHLVQNDIDAVTQRMLAASIYLGTQGLGSACDIAHIHGASDLEPKNILHYMTSFQTSHLNLGLARWSALNDTNPHERIFSHSANAGQLIAPLFQQTEGQLGKSAMFTRAFLGLIKGFQMQMARAIGWHETTTADMTFPDGRIQNIPTLEALSHAIPLAGKVGGFPGTPQPGIGLKILPDNDFMTPWRIAQEALFKGFRAMRGHPAALLPTSRLTSMDALTLPDSQEFMRLQEGLNVGEAVSMRFYDSARQMVELPLQIDGDFAGIASELSIQALPPYPHFMTLPGSLMSRLMLGLGPQ